MSIDFKPSQVVLREPVPFIGTFGRCEAEVAAAWLVLAMRANGDTWTPVPPKNMGATAQAHRGEKGFSWLENPFAIPDWDDLIERGFARFVGPEEEERKRPLEFTDLGLERLRRWVKS